MTTGRLRALIRRRVRYRVTLGGVLFLLALALTGAGAFLSGNNLLFLIFAAMLALLLVSGFLSRLVLSGLELELLLPEHVAARNPASARVRLRNLKRFTPSFSIELAGRRDPLTGGPSILTAPVYFPLLPGHATLEAAITVVFPRRGRHRENLFVLATRFPFGFLRKTTTVALRRETVVFPSIDPRPGMETLLDSIAGELESHLRGMGRDFYRIRPYEPHDSARHVDWKSTAHTGALQIREFTREQQRTVEIYLDRRIAPGQQDLFEDLVERCAYLAWRLADRDATLRFRSQRFSFAIPEDGEIYDVLRYLALVEPIARLRAKHEAAVEELELKEEISGEPAVEAPDDESSLQILFSARPGDYEAAGWSDARVISSTPPETEEN